MATGISTATCPDIRALQSPDVKVITSEWERGRWEQDCGMGAVMRWGGQWDGGTGH